MQRRKEPPVRDAQPDLAGQQRGKATPVRRRTSNKSPATTWAPANNGMK